MRLTPILPGNIGATLLCCLRRNIREWGRGGGIGAQDLSGSLSNRNILGVRPNIHRLHTSKHSICPHWHEVYGIIRITVQCMNSQYDLWPGFTEFKHLQFWEENLGSERRGDHWSDQSSCFARDSARPSVLGRLGLLVPLVTTQSQMFFTEWTGSQASGIWASRSCMSDLLLGLTHGTLFSLWGFIQS